jgi:hypothetical protein
MTRVVNEDFEIMIELRRGLNLDRTLSHADIIDLRYVNQTGTTANPAHNFNGSYALADIDPTCDVGRPCQDKSCCNGKFCGRRPEYCDKSVCISNCDAKVGVLM